VNAGFRWTDARVREVLGIPGASGDDQEFSGVTTDTRTLGPGALFVALVGDRFDGHAFLEEARERGAAGAVVSTRSAASLEASTSGLRIYPVDDTLVALGLLARHRRGVLPGRVVGITGSSGKTTVKDLLAAALRGTFRVHATRGNLNNRVGVPLTLLAAPEDAEVVVVEMGTNAPGEIAMLARVADPDASLVTTVSEAHLSGLGSLEGVLEEKLDLVRGTREGGGVLVGDRPEALSRRAREIRPDVRVAGLSERADPDLRGELLPPDGDARFGVRWRGREVRAGIPGRHGAEGLVLALAMAEWLGADPEAAARGAAEVQAGGLRNEIRRVGDLTLLLDCYNANPQSVGAALDLLLELPASKGRVAVLGSMLELGERSGALHREVLDRARALPLELVVAVGEFAAAAGAEPGDPGTGPEVIQAGTAEEAYRRLKGRLSGGETILLKGSRGMALEAIVPDFERDFSTGADPREGDR